jgi:DNA-binding HxlR family transcriptional regulator
MVNSDLLPGGPHSESHLTCPITFILDILSSKWTIQILRELYLQPTRTRRFLKVIPGLNMKTLSERLRMLESYQLIVRTVFSERPLKVEYRLSVKGQELYSVLLSLKQLGASWLGCQCKCSFERFPDGSDVEMDCPGRRTPQRQPIHHLTDVR